MLMRVALLALLALAFARPFFGKKVVDTRHEFSTASVIVLDTSGSMRRPGVADALKKEALDAVGSLNEGQDAAALITFADTANIDVPLSDKIAPVKAAAGAVTPGYGGTNIAEALSKANELLRSVRAKQKEIVLVSDLQKGGWSYFKGRLETGQRREAHPRSEADRCGQRTRHCRDERAEQPGARQATKLNLGAHRELFGPAAKQRQRRASARWEEGRRAADQHPGERNGGGAVSPCLRYAGR